MTLQYAHFDAMLSISKYRSMKKRWYMAHLVFK
jgi:hypothetical protein